MGIETYQQRFVVTNTRKQYSPPIITLNAFSSGFSFVCHLRHLQTEISEQAICPKTAQINNLPGAVWKYPKTQKHYSLVLSYPPSTLWIACINYKHRTGEGAESES